MPCLLQEALPEHSTSLPQSSRALSQQISAKDSASDPNCSPATGLTNFSLPWGTSAHLFLQFLSQHLQGPHRRQDGTASAPHKLQTWWAGWVPSGTLDV